MKAKILSPGPDGLLSTAALRELVDGLRRGALFAFPTDTVYGVGTDARGLRGSAPIYEAKLREPSKPVPYLVESASEARRWAEWPPAAEKLAGRWWPGPLTMVLRPTPAGRAIAGAPGIGLRVPRHPCLLGILKALGGPLASSSANRSGEPALFRAGEVVERFGDVAEFIVVQEEPLPGTESTVIDLTGAELKILRRGAVGEDELRRAVS